MTNFMRLLAAIVIWGAASAALAQENFWIQVEARPNRAQAEARAAEWDSRLDGVASFWTGGRWYAVVIGPFTDADARARLLQLRISGQIPVDSFVVRDTIFREQIYAGAPNPGGSTPQTAAPEATAEAEPEPIIPAEETLAEARAAERRLSRQEKRELQRALAYEGFYRSTIDGAFGPGTRRAVESWQIANRFEGTGFLTTKQRQTLLDTYLGDIASLGITPVTDTRAGISIDLPLAALGSPTYAPPFARYEASDGSGAMVMLISQSGNQTTLFGLYDVMQTLEIVPLEGERQRGRNSFTLTGADGDITSYTYAEVNGDTVKGFTLVWPVDDNKRRGLVLSALRNSFRSVDGVLPDILGDTTQSIDLLAGLEIRRPEKSRSGFYVSPTGAVLTTTEALGSCSRVTLGEEIEAEITAQETGLGLALLTPKTALAPLAVARLSTNAPRLGSEVAAAGFSFGGALSAPTLTFGALADVKGLTGDTNEERLSLTAEPGDAGGPVFDRSGAVVGMLRPRESDGSRVFPEDVNFATDAAVIAEFLSNAGVSAAAADPGAAMAPEDLTRLAADTTVLVNCWN
ncbi:MAG: trypsin-like peptidase domain-containing protein [Pseudomonadota bacterium]